MQIAGIKFEPRKTEPKYQVRFWSKKEKYDEFKKSCEESQLVVQDVFNQFMEQFVSAQKEREE